MALNGLKEAVDALGAVEKKVRKSLLRKAAVAGGKIVMRKYKDTVAKRSGTLARSIGHKVKVYQGAATDVIGARTGMTAVVKGRMEDPSKIAHLVEFGTRPHSTRRGSKLGRRGKADEGQTGKLNPGARAKPSLIPAKLSTGKQVIGLMTTILADGIASAGRGTA